MANQQAIQWFSGFFEGEGCFTFRLRNARGNNSGQIIEPKVCLSNTNLRAIEFSESILNSWLISYSRSVDQRINKLPCYSIEITKFSEILDFCEHMEPHIQCDKFRLKSFKDFCKLRLSKKRYSPYVEEWDIYHKHKNWRASETTRDGSFNHSIDWLAGIYEAEGELSRSNRWTNQLNVSICNTNNLVIEKVIEILKTNLFNPYISFYKATEKHQSYWLVSLYGNTKVNRFWSLIESSLVFRKEEWLKIMI